MPTPRIEIDDHGLFKRMQAFPKESAKVYSAGMDASLLIMHENVPPYPPPPPNSSYRRTGTLGRTLGSGMGGGRLGGAEISEYKKLGNGYLGRFGTRLKYAKYVIGEGTQAGHMSHWWTMKKVADRSKDKIITLWNGIAGKLMKFLDGKGL